jgi:hypothetical protein
MIVVVLFAYNEMKWHEIDFKVQEVKKANGEGRGGGHTCCEMPIFFINVIFLAIRELNKKLILH